LEKYKEIFLPGGHLEGTSPRVSSFKIKLYLNSDCVFKHSSKNDAEDENINHGHIIFLFFSVLLYTNFQLIIFWSSEII